MFSVYGSNTELPGSECKMGWFNNPFEQPRYSDLCPSILWVISTYFKICPYCTWLLCVPNWSFTKLFWPATLGRNFTCKIVGCSQNWGKRLIFCALTVAMFVFPWTRILLWDLVTNGSLNRLLRSREQPIFVSSNSPDRKSESHDIHGDYPDGLPMKIPCLMS